MDLLVKLHLHHIKFGVMLHRERKRFVKVNCKKNKTDNRSGKLKFPFGWISMNGHEFVID